MSQGVPERLLLEGMEGSPNNANLKGAYWMVLLVTRRFEEAESLVREMRAEYDRRRRHLVPRLEKIGLKVHTRPVGAFYVLADARHISHDSLALAKEILEATGVALTPGIDFGDGAEGFLRFSYANSIENIAEGMNRLEAYIKAR